MKKVLYAFFAGLLLASCGGRMTSTGNEAPHAAADAVTADKAMASRAAGERMASYKISLDLRVDDISEAKPLVLEKAKEFGGYMDSEKKEQIVVYIPASNADAFIKSIGDGIGDVKNLEKEGLDVTDSHDDAAAQLATLRAVRDRYKDLLKKATKVEEVLPIEKELERVEKQIQALETQVERIKKLSAYTRITIRLDDSTFVDRAGSAIMPIAILAALLTPLWLLAL
ncbi:MAG: DUF4349 domain-containing protein [Rickettsiales bacterium]|nr:DUF4349 domain-containing protein [Rickettsiales bacterium]